MQDMHLVIHGLAIKKHGTAEGVASVIGLDVARVEKLLRQAVDRGRVVEIQGKYMLTPMTRLELEGEYSRYCDAQRKDPQFLAAYEDFERINITLKTLITRWQSMEIGGKTVPNDHSNREYDEHIIAKLGDMHEQADKVLARLAERLPRMQIYRDKLLQALEKSEDGAVEWVSDAKIDSYHTVWFELHEDLLRIMGRQRVE